MRMKLTALKNKREYNKKYLQEHREENLEANKKWVEANKERRREIARASYHRRKEWKKLIEEAELKKALENVDQTNVGETEKK
jgi:hypothetical protein